MRDGFISAFMMSNIGGGEEAREAEEGAPSVNSATGGVRHARSKRRQVAGTARGREWPATVEKDNEAKDGDRDGRKSGVRAELSRVNV